MKTALLLGTALCVLCAWHAKSSRAESSGKGTQRAAHLEAQIGVKLDYLIYLPPDYDKQDAWPLLLFLHGAGERGSDLELVKKHGPPKLIAAGKDFPFVVVSPQCPADQWWEPVSLTALLDDVVRKQHIDPNRIYVTGLSMGGFATWSLASHTPDRFAAIVPICGGGEPFMAARIKRIPAWVFHGAKDGVVPLQRSESMVEALKKVGGQVKFTVYPEANHDSWTETYNNPQLYEWLLEHKRATQGS